MAYPVALNFQVTNVGSQWRFYHCYGSFLLISAMSFVFDNANCQHSIEPVTFQLRENRVQIFGWRDDLSGVSEYELEVYQMEYSVASGKLVLPDHPVHTLTWQQVGPMPTIELRNAGA